MGVQLCSAAFTILSIVFSLLFKPRSVPTRAPGHSRPPRALLLLPAVRALLVSAPLSLAHRVAVEAGLHIALVLTASHLLSNIYFVSMTRMLLILISWLRIFTEVLSDELARNTCRIYNFICDFVFSAGDGQRTNSQAVQIEPILRIGS